jgi:Sigma-70 region 2
VVYRDNVARVYRLMYVKVGNRPDAEDLTAEVFATALRPLRVSASAAEVLAYLLATARMVLAGHWRRTLGREITTLTDEDNLEATPADAPVSADTAGRRQRCWPSFSGGGGFDCGGRRSSGCRRRRRLDHPHPAHDEAAEPQTLIPNTGQWRTVAASADLTEGAVHGFDLGTVRLADRKPA